MACQVIGCPFSQDECTNCLICLSSDENNRSFLSPLPQFSLKFRPRHARNHNIDNQACGPPDVPVANPSSPWHSLNGVAQAPRVFVNIISYSGQNPHKRNRQMGSQYIQLILSLMPFLSPAPAASRYTW